MGAPHGAITMPDNRTTTLLLVEDDDVDAERVLRAARREATPFSIRRACDGLEALALLRGEIPPSPAFPCIVLLDLKMPRMGGLQFLAELRRDAALRQTTVFVLTTSLHGDDRRTAYDLGIAGYIPKRQADNDFGPVMTMLRFYNDVVELPQE